MKKVDDEYFNKIWSTRKYKELWDTSTIEFRASIFFTFVVAIISFFIILSRGGDVFVSVGISVINDIAIALIGFLGFIVAGLAILTGTISSKVITFFKSKGAYSSLESILISFYFIGLLTAIDIMIIFVLYLLAQIPFPSIFILNIILTCIITYLFVFILFYSVGLVSNCLSIFTIISDVENQIIKEEESVREIYDSYRIIALEYIILMTNDKFKYELYDKKIEELINKDHRTTVEQKDKIFGMWESHLKK